LNVTRGLPPDQVVLLTTGSQGEPTSALVRISNQAHRDVSVVPGDTVVISATPIPGNELPVSRTIDNLLRQGARVLYDRIATVHVHGHASQEELKLVLTLVNPRYFVPVHGEYRHLRAHAQLAWDLGVAQKGIFVLEDGEVLEISGEGARSEEHIPVGPIFIDGISARDMQSPVLDQRKSLSKDGVVVVVMPVDGDTHRPAGAPLTVASGFMEESETRQLFEDLGVALVKKLSADGWDSHDELKTKVRETARGFIGSATRRSPMIIPVVTEV
jgi:ribonuclease J